MALIIQSKGEAILPVTGTDIDLGTVYARLDISFPIDGKTVKITPTLFYDKQKFVSNENDNVPMSNQKFLISVVVKTVGFKYDIYDAHALAKQIYEAMGYVVTIIDLN